jgi:uncharacterized membrane protein
MEGRTAGSVKQSSAFRPRGHEVTRLEAFSDVVLGFALTLLVVSLEAPHSYRELIADMRGLLPFACCFAILVWIWALHHKFFRNYALTDAVTMTLNFVLLFVVLFYVYPLKFVFGSMFGTVDSASVNGGTEPAIRMEQLPTLMSIYGLGFTAVFLIFALMYAHALRKREQLQLNALEVFDTRTGIIENLFACSVGVMAILLSQIVPTKWAGLSGLFYMVLGIGFTWIGWKRGAQRRAIEADFNPSAGAAL